MKQTVLITGGAGFIGSHLCEALLASGYRVLAIDNLSSGRLENIAHLQSQPDFAFYRESIENEHLLDRLVSEAGIVIHLAAAVGVKMIVENPVYTIRTNINGTESVLSAANRYSCKILLASSSEVYGKSQQVPFREEDDCLIGPTINSRWAYATSKAVDEFLGLAYHRQFGLPVIVMRLFNTIGPHQTGRYGMVVPRFIHSALRHEPLEVYGDGAQTRCFCDVADVIYAVLRLMEHPGAVGQVFNIGSQEEISILDLARRVIALTGTSSSIQMIPYDQAYAPGFEDMRHRVPSLEKIRALMDFQPRCTLDESLTRVIAYIREHGES